MKQVIGYIDKSFTPEYLKRNNVNSNELIGATKQYCFGRMASKVDVIKDENPNDIIDKMVSINIGTIKNFNEETFIADVMFENPIPEDIFFKYYGKDSLPIYKNQ